MPSASILIQELGSYIGIPDLVPDSTGSCSLAFDDDIIVTFIVSSDEHVNAISAIGELDEASQSAMMRHVLEANFQPRKGAILRFAIDPGTNTVVILGRWDGQRENLTSFSRDIEMMVTSIENVRKAMASGDFSAQKSAQAPEPIGGSFIRG
jgi:hypothetical protein